LGAIPFHRWTAGLAANSAELALTVALVWGGALFALVLLAMTALSVEPLGASLGVERAVIVTAGVVTLILGVAAAYIHEDIAHIVTYSIVADAGIVLLAFGALDAGSWGAIRLWLLGFVLTRTAFAAWAAAIRSAFGTRRLRDLGGWARRAPLLALAVVVIAVVTIGWPGFALFDARSAVVASATGGPFTAIVLIGTLAHVGYFGRILAAGIGRRSSAVAGGMGPWPSWPARGVRLMPSDAERLWTANRAPIAAALVLALAMLSLLVSAGGLDGPRAAAGPAPRVTPSPSASPTPSPTPRPLPTGRPTATPTPVESPSEPATGSPAPGDGSASPSSGNPSGSPVSPSP
jgi:formate hydrogenlyase subunit 3/multisubunit Na+/H+ antiporter MnhD subunit